MPRSEIGRQLQAVIADALRRAVSAFRAEHPDEHIYFLTLTTTGEALRPALSLWTREALARHAAELGERSAALVKWSYADSPYSLWGDEHFERVKEVFEARGDLPDGAAGDREYRLRLDSMERALMQVDAEGLFGIGAARLGMVVLVEVMPPDPSNARAAKRLNPPAALSEWLAAFAEGEEPP